MGQWQYILNVGTRWMLELSFRHHDAHCVGDWVGSRDCLDVEERRISLPLPRIKVNTFDKAYI
jgi:hypothetical protein